MVENEKYYKKMVVIGGAEDRPLVVQLCGHDKHTLLKAVNRVKDKCDIVGKVSSLLVDAFY